MQAQHCIKCIDHEDLLLRSGKKYLYKKSVGMVEKYLAFAKRAVNEVVSLKSDDITFLFERHYPEVIKG